MMVAEDLADLRRWLVSAVIVVIAHGAVAMVGWREVIDPAEPPAAIVVEFAPVPISPATQQTDLPPGPEQVMSDASPDKPFQNVEESTEKKVEQKVETKPEKEVEAPVGTIKAEELPPEIKPAPNPDVAMPSPAPPERKQQTVQRQEPRPPAPITSAPPAVPVQQAPIPAAPAEGPSTPRQSNAVPTWTSRVVALLERNKRYPPEAQSRREQGVVQVFFSLDRQGRVVESRIVRSSGAGALDEEALALLRRAAPFPAPPAEMPGAQVNLTVPIRFNLK